MVKRCETDTNNTHVHVTMTRRFQQHRQIWASVRTYTERIFSISLIRWTECTCTPGWIGVFVSDDKKIWPKVHLHNHMHLVQTNDSLIFHSCIKKRLFHLFIFVHALLLHQKWHEFARLEFWALYRVVAAGCMIFRKL